MTVPICLLSRPNAGTRARVSVRVEHGREFPNTAGQLKSQSVQFLKFAHAAMPEPCERTVKPFRLKNAAQFSEPSFSLIVHAVNSFYPMKAALRNLYETLVLQRKISHDGDPDLHWEFAE
jgi:hypothetical protein